MKKLLHRLAVLLLAGWALGAHAQSVWTYVVIGADNKSTVATKPPMDISYPAPGAPMPIYNPNMTQGTLLTSQEEAARLNAPKLIIMLGNGIR